MLLVVFVLLFILGLFVFKNASKWKLGWAWETAAECFGLIAFVASAICIIISLFIIGNNYSTVDGYIAKNEQLYTSLVYQLENEVYENDNDLGKRELYKDIEEWNKDLAYRKAVEDNFWTGIYTPNVHDQFEFIELK